MIPVVPKPEPDDFDYKVRVPGRVFLANYPNPNKDDYKKRGSKIWGKALDRLYNDYSKICAYSAEWVPKKDRSVDHYVPKSKNRLLAFEWTNFRLASKQLNENKSAHIVLDPFLIGKDWFTLDFDLNLIRPNNTLDAVTRLKIEDTISLLKLNDLILQTKRTHWIDAYFRGRTGLNGLRKRAPFIVYELERQNLVEEIKTKHERFLRLTGKL